MDLEKTLPILTAIELRVLGSLIEKSKITPDYYPMTINGLTAACNQRTSRRPVVTYEESEVMAAVTSLKSRSLVATSVGGSSRSVKYKHNFTTVFTVSDAELYVICLLMLRGPQTPGEINTNSTRLFEFTSIDQVHDTLNKLINLPEPFVVEIPKHAGQKEVRYMHLLGEDVLIEENHSHDHPASRSTDVHALEERINDLELELSEVKETVARLMNEIFGT